MTLQHALDLRPDLSVRLSEFYGLLWSEQLVEPVLLELCRLRIAQLLGDEEQQAVRYRPAMATGLDEEKIAALPHAHASPHYSDHERTCLAYAEQYVVDVHGITDDDARLVQRGMSNAEFVAFTIALGMLESLARMRLALALNGPVPDHPIVVDPPAPGSPLP